MKRSGYMLLLVLLSAILHTAFAQNSGDSVFTGTQVHAINIQFPQPNYWDSLTIYYNQGNEQYIPATVIINGVTYDSVGVRLKGNSSYSHPNNKKSIRLSFDEYLPDQRWNKLKGVHLNNCWGDPTFMREKIHLDFCRDAGVHAPRANFARVSFNDTLWAFYSLVEHVNKTFLSNHYGDNSGDLFKAIDGFGGGNPQVSNFRWYTAVPDSYYTRYEMKTEESTTAWGNLVTLLDTINNNPNTVTALPAKVNVASLYKAVAADILFANLDSYINSSRNFYFYFHPVTDRMEWIVWDTGLSFGSYTGGVPNLENLSVTYLSNTANRPLVGKIFNTVALRNEYLRTLCLMYNGYFSSTRLFPHIDSVANVIRPYVYEDPRKMYTNTQFETNITSDINASGGGGTRKPGLKSFINLRQTNVQTQLTTLGINCALTVSPGDIVINEFMADNDTIADPAGEFDDWIELYNNSTNPLDLGGMYLSDDPGLPTKWQFPANTIIGPNEYLIVWADNDSTQTGLHANFALSANGEFILLSNTDASILDTVTFGPQTTNRTMARIPNGTGPFLQARPTFGTNNNGSIIVDPVLTTLILPKYMQGNNGTNANRLPFAYRARITGLLPGGAYRYINQVVTSGDAATANGSGNCIYVQQSGDFVRTTGPSISTSGAYGTFTADETGMYEGWFVTEPTGNARFVPGRYVFMRIGLNDGGSGTSVDVRLTTSDSVRVLKLDPVVSDSTGTGLRGSSEASPKDFVFVFDDIAGAGRPLSGTYIESDGTANSAGNNYAAFYSTSVDGVGGAFGLAIPNELSTGMRRVERRSRATGSILAHAIDDDGIWPSGASTVNPSGGTSAIVLTGEDVGQLSSSLQSVSVYVSAGWNLISNPMTVANDSVSVLYPTSLFSYAFAFSAGLGYTQSETMANGRGYWGKFPSSISNEIAGTYRMADTIHVESGWNLVGTISSPVDTSVVMSEPPGLRVSDWFGFTEAGYIPATELIPGKAYWVKASGTGMFILTASSSKHTGK